MRSGAPLVDEIKSQLPAHPLERQPISPALQNASDAADLGLRVRAAYGF